MATGCRSPVLWRRAARTGKRKARRSVQWLWPLIAPVGVALACGESWADPQVVSPSGLPVQVRPTYPEPGLPAFSFPQGGATLQSGVGSGTTGTQGTSETGRIVNIASDAARVGSSGEAVYAACKGGLVAFSKTIAREHARHGITINVVCPGPTDTALFAEYKQGAGNPEKLVEAFTRSIPLGRIASRTTCRARSCSSPATRRLTSPARCSASQAA